MSPASLPRLLLGMRADRALTLAEHLDIHGPPSGAGPDLTDIARASGLRGRGGASFPTGEKLRSVAAARRTPKVLVNGAEGEPASSKDRLLMEALPHLVLDGAAAAAAAVGADECVIAVKETARPSLSALAAALGEREAAGLDGVPMRVVPVRARYVASEESALVDWVNGGAGRPLTTPPRPFQSGIARRPTLVQNAETMAHLALVERHGAHWFRALGTASEPGSTLITLSGNVAAPGVYEIPRGAPLAELLSDAGGPAPGQLQALILGGYFGSWLAGDALDAVTLEDAALAPLGSAMGAGAIVALDRSACVPAETARVARWMAGESAQQCGPCQFGLPALAGALESVVAGRASRQVWSDVRRWIGQVRGRGACHHPDGTIRFISSSLRAFGEQWDDHAAHGPCEACAGARRLPLPPGAGRPVEAAA